MQISKILGIKKKKKKKGGLKIKVRGEKKGLLKDVVTRRRKQREALKHLDES